MSAKKDCSLLAFAVIWFQRNGLEVDSITMVSRSCVSLCLLVAVAASSAAASPTTRASEEALQVLLTGLDGDLDRLQKAPQSADAILDFSLKASASFWRTLAVADDPNAFIAEYAKAFGAGDWRQDLKLVLMLPEASMPDSREPWKDAREEPNGADRAALLRHVANEVSRVQVGKCAADSKYLDRLYQLTLWKGALGVDNGQRFWLKQLGRSVHQGAIHDDPAAVWWHIRNFRIACHALRLDDWAKDVSPRNFREKAAWLMNLQETVFGLGLIPATDGLTWVPALNRGEVDPNPIPSRPFAEGPQVRALIVSWFMPVESKEVRKSMDVAAIHFLKHQRRTD